MAGIRNGWPQAREFTRCIVVAFDLMPPAPSCISDERRATVLEQVIADANPVPADFDWWSHLPPNAVA